MLLQISLFTILDSWSHGNRLQSFSSNLCCNNDVFSLQDNVPYKPPEYGEGLEELDEVYVQEDDIQAEEIQEEIQTEIHVIQELQVEDEQWITTPTASAAFAV